jgi:hypothetical protein
VLKKLLTLPTLLEMPYNALPVGVASGSCPEVSFWSITLLARSLCGTCPRCWFMVSLRMADHSDIETWRVMTRTGTGESVHAAAETDAVTIGCDISDNLVAEQAA